MLSMWFTRMVLFPFVTLVCLLVACTVSGPSEDNGVGTDPTGPTINAVVSGWDQGAGTLVALNGLNDVVIASGTISETGVMSLVLPETLSTTQLKNLVPEDLTVFLVPLACIDDLAIALNEADASITFDLEVRQGSTLIETLVNGTLTVDTIEGSVTSRVILRVFSTSSFQISGSCATVDPDLGVPLNGSFSIDVPVGWSLVEASLTFQADSSIDGTVTTVPNTNLPWRPLSEVFPLSAPQAQRSGILAPLLR